MLVVPVSFVARRQDLRARLRAAADTLPARLSDQEFWQLSGTRPRTTATPIGQPAVERNLVSNRDPDLLVRCEARRRIWASGRAGLHLHRRAKPKMVHHRHPSRQSAHAVDGKALFELSADRADFMSRLFAKKRPAGLTPQTSADLQQAY